LESGEADEVRARHGWAGQTQKRIKMFFLFFFMFYGFLLVFYWNSIGFLGFILDFFLY
jgi:hypothetical protein